VAQLNPDGSPDAGAANGYSTDSLIDAAIALEFSEGDSFEVKNGCGGVCATFEDCDRLKRAELTLQLCTLDAELLSLLVAGSTLFSQLGDSIGWEAPPLSTPCSDGVSVELWAKAWNVDSQALPPYLGGTTPGYYRFFFPRVVFRPGDVTLENEFARTPVIGKASTNPGMRDDGPYQDFPTGVSGAGGITNLYGWFIDDAPPPAVCGFIAVPAPPP
jgi:hypothetical protein